MHAGIRWASETPDLFSSSTGCPWGGRHRMIVEALPCGGWDWVAWTDDGTRRCLSGCTRTRDEAMEAAEASAMLLSRAPLAGRAALPALLLN